ncbi:hypothetical protein [Bradyrhizobium sp. 6(2017)]|uniref:hypothetical protein n=1 Tax=Bradyrhizobium sp. 6(2017) TaxID=1197460 RepID=UPI0013E11668|nr:hypothetical protein [Bradyrhizobium sp. 6(2017)]QIG92444.1 hypothetical protein G6P99_07945 [Bradyrhizobium sp. 6(2017)]
MANKKASQTLKKADVIKATQINEQTFEHWTDRRVIRLSGEDDPGDGRGKPRRFGMRTITKLAIAHRISLLGIPANMAVTLSSQFVDEPQRGRNIGCLFPTGRTILTATQDGAATIHNVQPDGDIDSILKTEAALVVDIGSIIENLHLRLNTIL